MEIIGPRETMVERPIDVESHKTTTLSALVQCMRCTNGMSAAGRLEKRVPHDSVAVISSRVHARCQRHQTEIEYKCSSVAWGHCGTSRNLQTNVHLHSLQCRNILEDVGRQGGDIVAVEPPFRVERSGRAKERRQASIRIIFLLLYMVINNAWSTHQGVVNRPTCTGSAFRRTRNCTESTPPHGDLGMIAMMITRKTTTNSRYVRRRIRPPKSNLVDSINSGGTD